MYFIVACLLIGVLLALLLKRLGIPIDSFEKLKQIVADIVNRKEEHFLSNLFQVEEKSKRHGGELVAAVLKAHNVHEIFALCGGHISAILVAAEKLGIRIVDTRHEVNAVFAADAVARLRQSIGVAAVTAGPGVTNTITAVKNAQMAEVPLLLLGGAAPTLLQNRGALQDIDQLALFRSICKYSARVTRVQDIVPKLRQAIWYAQSGTPGPVFVELPVDVLYPYDLVASSIGFIKEPKDLKQIMVNQYLRLHLSQMFGSAWIEQDLFQIPPEIKYPEENDLDKAVELIKIAKRPLLLIGSQALLPPVKPDDLRSAVEKLKIPTYLGGMGRGLLGVNNSYNMRQNRKDALKEADVVILAGMVCDFRLAYGRSLPSRGKIVSINRNREQLYKNEGVFWKANTAINADVGSTLAVLSKRLNADGYKGCPEEWLTTLTEKEVAKNTANAKKAEEKAADGNLNPLKVLSALNKALPNNAILIADGGDFVGSAAYIVQPRGPLGWLDPGAFGTLGVGGGFALGAKMVYPDRPVFIIYGDGACGFSIMEFDTLVRHNLAVAAIIGNDACWSQIAREQVPMFNSTVGCNLAHTQYDQLAISLGAQGELFDKKDDGKLDDRFSKFVDTVVKGKCVVGNVIIGKSNFREGSISV